MEKQKECRFCQKLLTQKDIAVNQQYLNDLREQINECPIESLKNDLKKLDFLLCEKCYNETDELGASQIDKEKNLFSKDWDLTIMDGGMIFTKKDKRKGRKKSPLLF